MRGRFDVEGEAIHRARNVIKILPFGPSEAVVKSFRVPNLLNRVVYVFFRRGKARASFENALQLQELGVSTPAPIGFSEYRIFGLFERSFYLSERFAYDFTIREPLLDKSFPDRRRIFEALARFTAGAHAQGVWHLDYSPGNILIQHLEEGYRFSIVDINRMRFAVVPSEMGLRNFDKLWADPEDMAVIAAAYATARGIDPAEAVTRAVAFDAANKRRKNRKKLLKHLLGIGKQ